MSEIIENLAEFKESEFSPLDLNEIPQISVSRSMEWYRKKEAENYERSYGVHVTDIVKPAGRACNGVFHLLILNYPRTPENLKFLKKRFEIGHAFHFWAYQSVAEAFHQYYDLELGLYRIVSVEIEKPLGLDPWFMTGTPDLVLTVEPYASPGKHIRIVYDVKSSSNAQLEQYRTKNGIKVPLDYRMQTQIYIAKRNAHFGAVYWITVNRPYLEFDSYVPRAPSVLKSYRDRIEKILPKTMSGGEPAFSPGKHCSGCPVSSSCPHSAT